MTKKTLQLLATVALVTGMGLASATTAHAADTDNTGTATTSGNVTLTAGDGEEGGGNAGGINLKSAPWINIPSTEINGKYQEIPAYVNTSDTLSKDYNGQVQVVNPGKKSDWNVQVQADKFTTADGKDALNASTLVLSGVKVAANEANNAGLAPSLVNNLTFNTGDATANQTVVAADYATNKEGVGTWNTTYAGATLNLSAGNVAGEYKSNLTWTLTNTPVS